MKTKLFRIIVLTLFLASCQPRETEVVILSLNDLHAKIDNMDKVAAYVNEQRAQNSNVLLLSAGDLFSGNPVVDYYPDKGYPIIDIMNYMRFDVSTIGNHEFDYGQEILAKRIEQANFPFVCANINTDSSPIPALKPYIFFTKGGEKICIVGLIQERPEAHEDKLKKLVFTNPIEEFAKYVPLREKSNLLVALTHIGVLEDTLLASRYSALDLIVGGHSHTKLDTGVLINDVLVTQAYRYVSYIGQTTVKFKNGKVVSKRNRLVDVAQLTQKDTAVTRKIAQYNNNPEMQQVVGTFKRPIVGGFNIGNFFCDAVRAQTHSDIAFQNLFGVRMDSLAKGPLTKKDLYLADPFGNEIIQFTMTGAEVLQFITSVYNHFQRLDLCVSGMRYKVTVKNKQASVQAFLPNGNPIDKHKKYTVAMNSYMSTKTEEYQLPVNDKGKGLKITTAEATEQYLLHAKEVGYSSPKRAELVIP